jgi:CXXC motif containing zinc binding protein, eukaryotic
MPEFKVYFKATLENVAKLAIEEQARHYFSLECTNCGAEHNELYLKPSDEYEHGRGRCNFLMKCAECKRQITVDLLSTTPYEAEHSETWSDFVAFEVRGAVLSGYSLTNGYIVNSAKSSNTYEVDFLEDDDWCEYDDRADASLSILQTHVKVEKQ